MFFLTLCLLFIILQKILCETLSPLFPSEPYMVHLIKKIIFILEEIIQKFTLSPLFPSVPYMVHLVKIILILKGIIKKFPMIVETMSR